MSGTTVTVTASNESGTSEALNTKIVKVAPDAPKVDPVYEGKKKITGTVELLDYAVSSGDGSQEVPKEFKDAPARVAETQTTVYAQIGKEIQRKY